MLDLLLRLDESEAQLRAAQRTAYEPQHALVEE
jgi:hypothetical protein